MSKIFLLEKKEISMMSTSEINKELNTILNTKPDLFKLIEHEQNQIRKMDLLEEYNILCLNEINLIAYTQFLLIYNN